uniref:Uncharacterized protein n=1 Tax=Cucumis sativus TaxID=3659 RepID=A0A0A0LDG0_CUCSA
MSSSSPVTGFPPANWFLASPTQEEQVLQLRFIMEVALLQAYFMQIDGTLNKLTTEPSAYVGAGAFRRVIIGVMKLW